MRVTIRDAAAADLDALRSVFRRSALTNDHDRAALLAEPDTLWWSGESIADGRTRVAVGDGGEIAGFATTEPRDGSWELDDLFVDPRWMRRGVGRRLVEDAIEETRRAGVGRLTVSANPHALAFYTAIGFVPDGTEHTRFGPVPRLRLDLSG